MPVVLEFRGPVLVVSTQGVYSNQELEQALADARQDPSFPPGTSVLFDGRHSETHVSSADVQWRIRLLERLAIGGFSRRFALMVREGDPLRFGMARQLSLAVELSGITLRLFSDERAAIEWLGAKGP